MLHQILVSTQVNEENAEEEIREAFRVFDGDGNGFIDRFFYILRLLMKILLRMINGDGIGLIDSLLAFREY